ncbi:MAG: transposase [Sideroxyarcus sp.]|nr:transposase [Sideroxyarcus sp.]
MPKFPTPQSKRLRIGRVSLPHHIYLITIVTESRAGIFSRHEAASTAARCLCEEAIVRHADTLAFVVMPDPIHWLMQLKESVSLSEIVRRYKARVSVLLGRRIWQHSFHDHALRAEEDIIGAARYLVANPLRAGLCEEIGNYPYWNAKWL